MNQTKTLLSLDIKGVPLLKKGKVREVYALGDKLLFVASDRISAFDVIMQNGIPRKGEVLTMISAFWFNFLRGIIKNHMLSVDIDEIIAADSRLKSYGENLKGRSMLVRKTEPVLIECVVRGYLSGSGWKDYQKTGKVCNITLPPGLKESSKLDKAIFTPSTKADAGHDENISEDRAKQVVGEKIFNFLKKTSIAIYETAREYAEKNGIIIADTKFEFGKLGDEIILIDEVLTPDSSRFWPRDEYEAGGAQKSFDKQFVRDYLETLDWDKTPPGPELPPDIVKKTQEKYLQAYRILTGKEL